MHGRGGVHDGGCAWQGGMRGRGRGVCMAGGVRDRGVCVAGGHAWPCDLSHHAFEVPVCCLLTNRPTNSAAPYIVLVGHVTCTPPLVNRMNDRHL